MSKKWALSLSNLQETQFSSENHKLVMIDGFLKSPETAICDASLQKFAKITPQYPGIRAALPQEVSIDWARALTAMLDRCFGQAENGWETRGWYSLVTARPGDLLPLQRFPHVDGTDPSQVAMMLYLHHTDHGGTGFFRHKSTGFEALNDANFPLYRAALEEDVRREGMPKAEYVSSGAPHFERIHQCDGFFNQAAFYRGNILHSGLIKNDADLSSDPATGRLTINAFFRPIV